MCSLAIFKEDKNYCRPRDKRLIQEADNSYDRTKKIK